MKTQNSYMVRVETSPQSHENFLIKASCQEEVIQKLESYFHNVVESFQIFQMIREIPWDPSEDIR